MLFGFNEPTVPTVEAEEVKKAIDAKESCIIVDVRTPGEYLRGKLQGSVNLPVELVETKAKTLFPDVKQKIYVYCLSGARSSVAVDSMRTLGYSNVFSMSHGLLAWRVKYFPVVIS
jgi:rhodanese-related sulfurtransferase